MLEFKELSKDGKDLELLIREILLVKGFKVQWSGIGADGGKDLICYEERPSEFLTDSKKWLIQCKHKAHSRQSVGVTDLDDIVDSCNQHDAKGYLLVCSTFPSSAVINRLDGITKNPTNAIDATYWDATIIEQKLSTPQLWKIAQTFFPLSSKKSSWQIYATDNPNRWIVNFRGYHFHLSNRIGSVGHRHFPSIDQRINDIENIKLKKGHFIRIRAVNFDDKHATYVWFLDYMYPYDKSPVISNDRIAQLLGNDEILEYGQYYVFDVISRPYFPFSDHYDKDHYDYYLPYLENFYTGFERKIYETMGKEPFFPWDEMQKEEELNKETYFAAFIAKLKSISFIRVLGYSNSTIEDLDKFAKLRDWATLIEEKRIDVHHFFSTTVVIDAGDNEKDFLELMSYLPQESECTFRVTKAFIYTPKMEGEGSELHEDKKSYFDVTIRIDPTLAHTSTIGRQVLNDYFDKCAKMLDSYPSIHR